MEAIVATGRGPHRPVRKVAGAGAAGAASTVLIWVLGALGVKTTPEVAAAFTTLFAFGAGYVLRQR